LNLNKAYRRASIFFSITSTSTPSPTGLDTPTQYNPPRNNNQSDSSTQPIVGELETPKNSKPSQKRRSAGSILPVYFEFKEGNLIAPLPPNIKSEPETIICSRAAGHEMRGIISKHGSLNGKFHYLDIALKQKLKKGDSNSNICQSPAFKNRVFLYDNKKKILIDFNDSAQTIQLLPATNLLLKNLFEKDFGIIKNEQYQYLTIRRKQTTGWKITCTNANADDINFISTRLNSANGDQASYWDMGFTRNTRYHIAGKIRALCDNRTDGILSKLEKLNPEELKKELENMHFKYEGALKMAINFIFNRPFLMDASQL
jgi:hypothetical protein